MRERIICRQFDGYDSAIAPVHFRAVQLCHSCRVDEEGALVKDKFARLSTAEEALYFLYLKRSKFLEVAFLFENLGFDGRAEPVPAVMAIELEVMDAVLVIPHEYVLWFGGIVLPLRIDVYPAKTEIASSHFPFPSFRRQGAGDIPRPRSYAYICFTGYSDCLSSYPSWS